MEKDLTNIYELLGIPDPNKPTIFKPEKPERLNDPLSQSIEAMLYAERTGDWGFIANRYKEIRERKGNTL